MTGTIAQQAFPLPPSTPAKRLIPSLLKLWTPGEESRWSAQSREFGEVIQRLTGDCAVAAGFVGYLGAFNRQFRELLLQRDFIGACQRLRVPVTPDLQVSRAALEVGWGRGVSWVALM